MGERQRCGRDVDARAGDDAEQQCADQRVGLDRPAIEHDRGGVTESLLELTCSTGRVRGEHLFGLRTKDEAIVSERHC